MRSLFTAAALALPDRVLHDVWL
ncbi:MAG: hypothetical protein QOH85_526, partial [Acidobacteriaceae bacterium]|nr:hypothetical protein [Acidobacteriaceae bacterium]